MKKKTMLEKATDYRASTNSYKFYVPTGLDIQGGVENKRPVPALRKGEIIITEADRVLLFPHSIERSTGLCGTIYVTTFRLCFKPYDGEIAQEAVHQKNLLVDGDHNICLSNVDALYEIAGGKKRRLLPDSTLTGKVLGLQVVCKNLRVLTFSFAQSSLHDGRSVSNTLLHHAFPGRHQLLFGYEYRGEATETSNHQSELQTSSERWELMFDKRQDWEELLHRCCVGNTDRWRVTLSNETFQLSANLPRWLIVPKSLVDSDLSQASGSFRCNRPPLWTWSTPDGAALIRMADLLPTITERTQENRMLEVIRRSQSHRTQPVVYELDKELPSVRDVRINYLKLRELCIVDSRRQFNVQDAHFYLSLDHTRWLHSVAACLHIASRAADSLSQGNTVVLQESDGRDTSAVVASLVQLLLDPRTRTIAGFQSLVQKEWVALGHPFCKRLGHVRSSEADQSPVFLLFLDSVWQLLLQYPAAFQFTETYLTTLWDCMHISVFDTFLFDCEKDRLTAFKQTSADPVLLPRSVWNWDEQFSPQDIEMFYNPLYNLPTLEKVVLKSTEAPARLQPNTKVFHLQLWMQCYCRWLSVLRIANGGAAQVDLVHRQLVHEIGQLMLLLQTMAPAAHTTTHTIHSLQLDPLKQSIDNFFPFSIECAGVLLNSSILSDSDTQSVLNLTDCQADSQSVLNMTD